MARRTPQNLDLILSADEAALREAVRALITEDPRFERALADKLAAPPSKTKAKRASDRSLAGDLAAFVRLARRDGLAAGESLDALFVRLGRAHERGEHAVVLDGARSLLSVLDEGIDVGQHELYIEVLSGDPDLLGAQILLSSYLATPMADRALALQEMLGMLGVLGIEFDEPLAAMGALGPLPEVAVFLPRWTEHLERLATERDAAVAPETAGAHRREAVKLSGGVDGLGALAKRSRDPEDLFEWVLTHAGHGEFAEVAQAARMAAGVVTLPAEQARFWVLAARGESGRGRSPTADLFEALVREPVDLTFRRWAASMLPKKRSAALAALPMKKVSALLASIAALDGEWAAVADAVPSDLYLAASPFGGPARAALEAIAWALVKDPATALSPIMGEWLTEDPAGWLDEDIAALDALPALPTPTWLALLDDTRPRKPTKSEAVLLLDALRRSALKTVESAAAHGKGRSYTAAATAFAVVVALVTEREGIDASADLLARGLTAAGRKTALQKQIEQAIGGRRRR